MYEKQQFKKCFKITVFIYEIDWIAKLNTNMWIMQIKYDIELYTKYNISFWFNLQTIYFL